MSKPETIPYMPMYWGDLLSSSTWMCMCPAAKGIYTELLGVSWIIDGLPIHLDAVRRLAKADPCEWEYFLPFLAETFPIDGDRRRNPRQEEERAKALGKYQRSVENGKQGGRPPKPKNNPEVLADDQNENPGVRESADYENLGKTQGLENGAKTKPRQKPINSELRTQNKELITPKSPEGTGGEFSDFASFFAEFKSRYPSRRGGQEWPKVSEKLSKVWKSQADAILEGADRYRNSMEYLGKVGTEYVKMASTWVGRRSWLDDSLCDDPVSAQPVAIIEPVENEDYFVNDQGEKIDLLTNRPFDESAWRKESAA